MTRMFLTFSLLFLMIIPNTNAGFVPPNTVLPITDQTSDMTEKEFNNIVDTIINLWTPYAKNHGVNLTSSKYWKDETVNAYASQMGNTWKVTFFGGLARRPEVTSDAFALVVCHELGHHFAGYYFYSHDWGACEGQADYFATHVCLKEAFKALPQKAIKRKDVDPTIQANCDTAWNTTEDRETCYRIGAAANSAAQLLAGGSSTPKPSTPSTKQVTYTNTEHPDAQCRLDTYLAGSICTVQFDKTVIPAKELGLNDQNSEKGESESNKYTCATANSDPYGYRPRCWFKPQL